MQTQTRLPPSCLQSPSDRVHPIPSTHNQHITHGLSHVPTPTPHPHRWTYRISLRAERKAETQTTRLPRLEADLAFGETNDILEDKYRVLRIAAQRLERDKRRC
ncbi:hypothetical protein T440DRAFT_15473 [Plenodomus tracheiphilus IPT5]|uniref:Uncharacterized protein n=1 Tax=Plenodomus tracheiphilus IPT5 TaxID=1408161 RepID=A0A6A7BNK4_9PLEO|nr:hypothetical protein T440DRAFT_15473 [Plenodomus tracheiphilus IPT5]